MFPISIAYAVPVVMYFALLSVQQNKLDRSRYQTILITELKTVIHSLTIYKFASKVTSECQGSRPI